MNISIHSPYTGRDWPLIRKHIPLTYFNPLSLYRERPADSRWYDIVWYISIHSPYTGRDGSDGISIFTRWTFQSTLPIQGETGRDIKRRNRGGISIHSPYTGRDSFARVYADLIMKDFNPLSLYRERLNSREVMEKWDNFNPLSLYRERPTAITVAGGAAIFQSTLPIQGETRSCQTPWHAERFQSTLPIQGETNILTDRVHKLSISIHSPYTGRDAE